MNKIKETRTIDFEKVRAMCIKYDLYTCGTNEEYTNLLLNLCSNENEMTTEQLYKITEDILIHSDTEMEWSSIMFNLANDCCYTFFEESCGGKDE